MARVGWAWKTRKPRSWRFDFEAIREQADELELKWPILVGPMEAGGSTQITYGAHRVKRDKSGRPFHQITVWRAGDAERTSRTLHHELEHARQAETIANFGQQYSQENWHGYKTNPFEVAARAASSRHETRPLAT